MSDDPTNGTPPPVAMVETPSVTITMLPDGENIAYVPNGAVTPEFMVQAAMVCLQARARAMVVEKSKLYLPPGVLR